MLTVIAILILMNVALFVARTSLSGAGVALTQTRPAKPAPEKCGDARRGLRYYIRVTNEWRSKMGAGNSLRTRGERSRVQSRVVRSACPRVRYLANVWRTKARNARLRYLRWLEHEYAWWRWLPDKYARVGACETGYGKRPGNWRWDSGTYVSAFGIYRPAYEAYHRWTGQNTPREQFEVAAAIQARYGWGAWGCGGA